MRFWFATIIASFTETWLKGIFGNTVDSSAFSSEKKKSSWGSYALSHGEIFLVTQVCVIDRLLTFSWVHSIQWVEKIHVMAALLSRVCPVRTVIYQMKITTVIQANLTALYLIHVKHRTLKALQGFLFLMWCTGFNYTVISDCPFFWRLSLSLSLSLYLCFLMFVFLMASNAALNILRFRVRLVSMWPKCGRLKSL